MALRGVDLKGQISSSILLTSGDTGQNENPGELTKLVILIKIDTSLITNFSYVYNLAFPI